MKEENSKSKSTNKERETKGKCKGKKKKDGKERRYRVHARVTKGIVRKSKR